MATYYVSTTGSDSNNGTTVSTPWQTLGKAIAAGSTVAAGDTVYFEPGIYRGSYIITVSGTSGNPIRLIGDVDGAGFKAGGAASPKVGMVMFTGYTNDLTAAGSGAPIKSSTASITYITLKNLLFAGPTTGAFGLLALVNGVSTTSFRGWTIQDCVFQLGHDAQAAGSTCISFKQAADVPLDWTVERCTFYSPLAAGSLGLITAQVFYGAVGETNLNMLVRNCVFIGGDFGFSLVLATNSSFLNKPYGVTIQDCSFLNQSRVGVCWYQNGATITANTTAVANGTNYIYGSFIMAVNYGIACGHASQCTEDGNYIIGGRSNATSVGNTRTTGAPLLNVGLERILGLPPRPMFEPLPISTSPFVGAGNYGTHSADDISARPRPDGMGSIYPAIGAFEVHDTGIRDATYADGGSGYDLKLGPGPMSQGRYILVNPVATTVSVKVRWDGNHADTTRPQAILLANPEIGVLTTQTVTATSSGGSGATPNSYETLTFSPITPTVAGVLELRLVSRPAAANGIAYFDTIALS